MNKILKYTLIADGSSDKCLLPIIRWTISQNFPDITIDGDLLDFRRLRKPPKKLESKIKLAQELIDRLDIVFVHRDAENQSYEQRKQEIIHSNTENFPCVYVIPVRMLETWFLLWKAEIRIAAGNKYGKMTLNLPAVNTLESIPDPKKILYDLIKKASGLSGRRLKKIRPNQILHNLSDRISNWSNLRDLKAFAHFESNLIEIINQLL